MAFCRYCGKPLDENVRFCPSCGAKQDGAPESPQRTAVPEDGGYDPSDVEKTKVVCAVSYISILFFLPLAVYPNSRFGKFHANQSLVLLIATTILNAAVSVISSIWWALPFLPDFSRGITGALLSLLGWGLPLAGTIYGFVNAVNGKAKELPIIGQINLINK